MTAYVGAFDSLEEAWWHTVSLLNRQPQGRAVNTIMAVTSPAADADPDFLFAIDETLRAQGRQSVSTVAGTLFPQRLYRSPGGSWRPNEPAIEDALDAAAGRLYRNYLTMLPTLMTHPENESGTYFSRMIAWPGKPETGGLNQLDKRIHYLRLAHGRGDRSHNASDITLQFAEDRDDVSPLSVQEYAATDDRQTSFPCLVHISLTVHQGRISMGVVYRHWFTITKGFGNLLGLSRLLHFLAEQTGYGVGELMVTATKGNAERTPFRRAGVDGLLLRTRAVLDARTEEEDESTA